MIQQYIKQYIKQYYNDDSNGNSIEVKFHDVEICNKCKYNHIEWVVEPLGYIGGTLYTQFYISSDYLFSIMAKFDSQDEYDIIQEKLLKICDSINIKLN